jgi:multicomponent Na+:H+ antiporter subunit B
MSWKPRAVAFLAAAAVALPLGLAGLGGLPAFGHYRGPYGDIVNHVAPGERHVTNMVTAVTFDYRGFDSLGEEFMLFCAVTGVLLLLRSHRGQSEDAAPARPPMRRSSGRTEGVTAGARALAALTLLFGIYVVLHATVTPGGGFQGGVIIGSATLLVYLGESYRAWRRAMRAHAIDIAEACGTGGYALAGLLPMLVGANFLENTLPIGEAGTIASGGLMAVINLSVGLAVASGFALLFIEFLEETREPEEGE